MMIRTTSLAFLAAIPLLGACKMGSDQFSSTSASTGTPSSAYEACKYEASIATANAGAAVPRSSADAVAGGVVAGMEDADLINQCMRLKGFSRG